MSAATSIDRALLGAGYTETVPVPSIGAVIRIRVLSPVEVRALGVALAGITEGSGGEAAKVTHSRVLHAACSMLDGSPAFDSPADVGQLPSQSVREIWRVYVRAHELTHSVSRALAKEIDDVSGDASSWVDQFRARYAAQLVAYFGLRSALEATAAQVLWLHGLLRER